MKNVMNVLRSTAILFACTMFFAFSSNSTDGNNGNYEERVKPNRVANHDTFTASLKSRNEVNPAEPIDSNGTGQAIVRISRDGSQIYYKLIVANIDNVVAAHFHMAPSGSNGPVVATLFMGMADGDVNGVLAEGVLDAEDYPGLVDSIRSGNIYVNVHSTDYPAGELRGQL